MLKKVSMLFLGFIVCTSSSIALGDETISLKVGYLLLSPSGEMAVTYQGIGTTLDLETDLGLDDSSGLMAQAALTFGDLKLTVEYLPLSFEGSSVLTRPIAFNGKLYPGGSTIQSSLDLNVFDIGLTWFLLNFDDIPTRFQFGLEMAVKVTGVDTSLSEDFSGLAESASATLPIPTLGLRARIAFSDFIGIAGRVGYLEYSGNHFLDGDLQLEFSPIPLVGIFAGYRYMDIAIDESDVFVDSVFSGFYGGALVRF